MRLVDDHELRAMRLAVLQLDQDGGIAKADIARLMRLLPIACIRHRPGSSPDKASMRLSACAGATPATASVAPSAHAPRAIVPTVPAMPKPRERSPPRTDAAANKRAAANNDRPNKVKI